MHRSPPSGIVSRRQPWIHNRFVRKSRHATAALVLAIPVSLALWALIWIAAT